MSRLAELLAANRRHAVAGGEAVAGLSEGQSPEVLTVCCSDSRVPGERILDVTEPGVSFTVENVGNRVLQRLPDDDLVVSGDALYPLCHTGTRLALVVGHTGCGAVTATYDAVRGEATPEPPGIEHCVDTLAARLAPAVADLPAGLSRATAVDRLVEHNVDAQVAALCESPDVPDGVTVAGLVYDFRDAYGPPGELTVVNVDGVADPERLREAHPELADRIARLTASRR